jgi:hypothetical protein
MRNLEGPALFKFGGRGMSALLQKRTIGKKSRHARFVPIAPLMHRSKADLRPKIKNTGSTADRLISGSSDVAPKFEVHEMKMENGVAKMRPITGGLEIKPGDTIELKPGSFHLCRFEKAAHGERRV